MCGIAGFFDTSRSGNYDLDETISKMNDTIRHRGPDGCGSWVNKNDGIALAQQRLAIIDLSENGKQPMVSQNGRYVVVYNGEIYNHEDIRKQLMGEGLAFKGKSDTEVLLTAIMHFGLEKSLGFLIGMFSFALWDRHLKTLTLARDRLGIKPLYWADMSGAFLFGSELKALREHPKFTTEIDRDAAASYFRHNYIPAPRTIYKNVFKLRPGHTLVINSDGRIQDDEYWSLKKVARHGQNNIFAGSDREATDQLEELLTDAISKRMIADVPLGAFLSGGIDSSIVAAIMQKNSRKPVKTFSIGFENPVFNEANHAKEIATHLKTDHTELYVNDNDVRSVIDILPTHYDEPFSDSSQIPTYLVSKLAKEHVTVSLSGDGGDELFAGYNRYLAAAGRIDQIFAIPKPVRKGLAGILDIMPPAMMTTLNSVAPQNYKLANPTNKAEKIARILRGEKSDFYKSLVSHWDQPNQLVLGANEYVSTDWNDHEDLPAANFVEKMAFLDTVTYFPDDILTKLDRASMAVALEARVPLADHRVAAFAWSLPFDMKIRNGTSKWLLREVLYRYVPKKLIDRPKMGFGVPLDDWLRGPLKEWAEDLLNPSTLTSQNILNAKIISQAWQEHQSGRQNLGYHLWDILMFQSWHNRWINGEGSP